MKNFFKTVTFAFAIFSSHPAGAQNGDPPEYEFREWTSTVGTKVTAKLINHENGRVTLSRMDGSKIVVPMNSLSEEDRDHLASLGPLGGATGGAKPKLPENFPKDEIIEAIPRLKKLNSKPLDYSFSDEVSGRTITSKQLRGKYVFVHSIVFSHRNSKLLQDLKLLHDKYAKKGFEIITIESVYYYDPQDQGSDLKNLVKKSVEDYGITWHISIPRKFGTNPVALTIADRTSFYWLFDPEGKLIHTNLTVSNLYYESNGRPLPLKEALEMIFPEE